MGKKSTASAFPLLLVFYEIAIYLSNDAYFPALPKMAKELAISHNTAQFTFTMWLLGGLSVQFIIGPLSDRFGRRPILLSGGILFILASIACALSTNIHMLLLGRYFQGAAVPTMIIAGYAAIHESLEQSEAIHALARMQSVTILAPAFGPLLGGILLLFVAWNSIFIILAIWAMLAITLLFYYMPETLSPAKRTPLDLKFIATQYLGLFKNIDFMRKLMAGAVMIAAICVWLVGGPFIVINKFQYSTVMYGVFQAVIFGSFILGTRCVKKWLSPHNLHRFVTNGISILLIAAFSMVIASYLIPDELSIAIIAMMFISFGAGLSFPILNRLTIEASDAPMGLRMTLLLASTTASSVVGTALLGIFYNGTILSLALVILPFTLISYLCIFRYQHPQQES